jgi:hypothetical protein
MAQTKGGDVMRRKIMYMLGSVAITIVVLIGITKHQIKQNQMQQWTENRDIIVVTVPLGVGIDYYGYKYKPKWMHIDEYREQIKELNDMKNCTLYTGQKLKLYKEVNQNA